MADKDIRESVTPTERRIAKIIAQLFDVTVEDVILSAQLGVEPKALLAQKQKAKTQSKGE